MTKYTTIEFGNNYTFIAMGTCYNQLGWGLFRDGHFIYMYYIFFYENYINIVRVIQKHNMFMCSLHHAHFANPIPQNPNPIPNPFYKYNHSFPPMIPKKFYSGPPPGPPNIPFVIFGIVFFYLVIRKV
jgi:hypothetical protein